jgi:hypothetical protein
MPVTIKPTPDKVGKNQDKSVKTSQDLLRETSTAWAAAVGSRSRNPNPNPETRRIINSSFSDLDHTTISQLSSKANNFSGSDTSSQVIPYGNGFVEGVIRAFEQDLHLVLRPDDVWLAIITQFSFYVNANVEAVRHLFVAHEGKKALKVDIRPTPVEAIDFGSFAQQMTLLIHANVKDPKLREWAMPNFTTTTDNDKSVAAIVMMGTLQKYFEYILCGGCGFPSVTLLGERADWEEILRRVEKLPSYGEQPATWAKLLIPVIKRMVVSFWLPESKEIKEFWLKTVHSNGEDGSGSRKTLSGWITAFCFWSEKGTCLDAKLHPEGPIYPGRGDCSVVDNRDEEDEELFADCMRLELDGVRYHLIYPGTPPYVATSIPKSVVSVPVTVRDEARGLEYATTMIAGSVGMIASNVGWLKDQTSVQPRSGWWILEDSVKPLE